jgi:hypothetical protein
MMAGRYSAVFLAALIAGCSVGAQTEAKDRFDSWFWHASVGLPVMHLDDEGSPYRFSLGGGRPVLHDRVSLMADLVFAYYDVNQTADEHPRPGITGGKSASLGFDLLLRIEFLQTAHLDGYLEGGAGFQSMLSEPPFPADGSDENLTLFAGPGILIPMGERSRLTLSLQWFHISNAWLFSNNSGYDGIQLVLGPEWSL